jgi:hypothetical protein
VLWGNISVKLSIFEAVRGITSIEKSPKKSLRDSLTFIFSSFEVNALKIDIILSS